MLEIASALIAGLVLFLFAISNLSEVLQKTLGKKAELYIQKYTGSTIKCLLVGLVATILLDSSSAVIIITIVMINSGHLTFPKAMRIVLGANIGTTVSSQIIALDIGKFSPALLLLGFVMLLVAKSEQVGNFGKTILYFGVLFFGLYTMENAVQPLHDDPVFMQSMKATDNPLTGAFIGAIVTVIIQSSSATVGIAIILAKKGMLSLTGGIAVMLGAELGTCSDTLLATIKGSKAALKTGLFHFIFNLLTIALGLLLFSYFVDVVKFLSTRASIEQTIANAHMLFNILGVLLFVWTIPFFEKLLNKLVPDKTSEARSLSSM